MRPGKMLLTVAYLDGLHGSVMHVAELSSYLVNIGWDVSVAAIHIDEKKIKGLFDGRVVLKPIFEIHGESFDVIWSYHFLTVGALFANEVRCRKLIYGCLSWFEKLETPPVFWEHCSVVHAVSRECAELLGKMYDLPKERFTVVENWLPDNYYAYKSDPKSKVRKIGVVSNHPPKEIKDLGLLFGKDSVCVEYIGGKNSRIVTPNLLSQYDVIVSIGKTVQYALGMGIPVYLYDRFGGCGYITLDNFERANWYNFSGRCICRKLDSVQIYDEICEGYFSVLKQLDGLRDLAVDKFLLSKNVDFILEKASKVPCVDLEEISRYKLYNAQCLEVCKRLSEKSLRKVKRKRVGLFGKLKLLLKKWKR